MTLTALLINFHDLLRGSAPFLFRVGITVGDDEWDDFVELAFQIAVCAPIERELGRSLDWTYGMWGQNEQFGTQIQATVTADTPILIGESESKGNPRSIRYREIKFPGLRFAFREFSHPLEEPGSVASMAHALGEVTTNELGMSAGTHICVPINVCDFGLMPR